MKPLFPIYIPSKGRADSRITMRSLDEMGVDYRVIVEEQEHDAYAAVMDPAKLLVLPRAYQDDYDIFSDLGYSSSKGSGPARNFAWDHAVSQGFGWYWCVDDNIQGFYRLNRNTKIRVRSGAFFRAMEEFCLRYTNIGMAGPNYEMFAPRREKVPPFIANTRIYSCNLIRCDVPFRWRGRYNEDTDLSLRLLKAGYCTVLFNAFLQNKVMTQRVKGGNQAIYSVGTKAKSQMLVDMHPDVARLVWKFNRWHHHVDYRPFRHQKLVRRPDLVLEDAPNEFGMTLAVVGGRTINRTI